MRLIAALIPIAKILPRASGAPVKNFAFRSQNKVRFDGKLKFLQPIVYKSQVATGVNRPVDASGPKVFEHGKEQGIDRGFGVVVHQSSIKIGAQKANHEGKIDDKPNFFHLFPMKSAYELAMERLEKQSPSLKLTDEQKAEIAEIESVARAKVAEKELFLQGQIAKAMATGDFETVQQLERQLGAEVRGIESDAEQKKERVRERRQ